MKYNVQTEIFEGPLDLLLHLVQSLEVDIHDIPMAEITEQYLTYIQAMKELELDVASEYLVMAATLLVIKSNMLLPKREDEPWEEVLLEAEDDPREELVERLIEYRKYKEAALGLKGREAARRQIYTKSPIDLSVFEQVIPVNKSDVSIYDMLGVFQKLLRRKKLQQPLTTKVARQEISIDKRMEEILKDLKSSSSRKSLVYFFNFPYKEQMIITFLAVLELMKRNEIFVKQESSFDDIFLMKIDEEKEIEDS